MNQRFVFGVADPTSHRPANGLGLSTGDDLALLCEDWRDKHVALEVMTWIDLLELGGSRPREGTVLGIVIAATDAEAWKTHVNSMDALSNPPMLGEVLELRLMGGIQQAVADWELVRLSARLIDLNFPAGRLWLLQEA
jgi:hypothetical protein